MLTGSPLGRVGLRTEHNLVSWIAGVLAGLVAFCSAEAEVDLQLQVIQSQYLSEPQNRIQTNSYSSLGIRLKGATDIKDSLSWGYDFLGLGAMDGSEHGYIAMPELFVSARPGVKGLRFTLGRERFVWSRFDEEWRMGIWQPYVRWDYLHPRPQGLTGLFAHWDNQDVQVTLFGTGIFLPDQGPQFEVVDGEFHSSNRWFRQPQSRHTVVDQDKRLNYELDSPKIDELILNPGYGVSLQVGGKEYGPWLKTSLANKPINQLHLGIDGYHNLSRIERFMESVAVVHPVVARHTVMTIEAGHRAEDYQGWISITEERPDNPDLPEEWEESSLYPTRFLGAMFSHRLNIPGWKTHWFKYGYLNVTEDVPRQGDVPQDTLESSLDRYPFKEVVSFEWTAPVIDRTRRRLDLGIRYLYSLPERGGLLSAKAELLWNQRTRWDLGVDILGSGVSDSSSDRGLMTLYRNNDRVMGGVTYVF